MLLDQLSAAGSRLTSVLSGQEIVARKLLGGAIIAEYGCDKARRLPGLAKLARNAQLILSGLLVGSTANVYLAPLHVNAKGKMQSAA